MKSYELYVKGLYGAILSQIAQKYPDMSRDCGRDLSRLLSLIDSRGLPFVTISLPEAGKHFDQCLAAERLIPFRMDGQRPYKKGSPIPRLFKGLLKRVFDDSGCLLQLVDTEAVRFLRQVYYLAKKLQLPCEDSKTWKQVHEFFTTDHRVQSPSLDWDSDDFDCDSARHLHFGDTSTRNRVLANRDFNEIWGESSDTRVLDYDLADAIQWTADAISSRIGVFDPELWRNKHGPGAVSDLKSYQFKYDFPNWPEKLSNVFPMSSFGFPNYTHWIDKLAAWANGDPSFSKHEPPSKLIAVPKTQKGPRLIAAEPTAYQWAQQAILSFLADRIAKVPVCRSIHLRDQTFNQNLALRASHTQSHVTVDLSSASDRLSCWVVERMFRSNPTLLHALHSTRTRWVVNTIDRKSPKFHKLRKFACMGSACTFPVQSIVFLTIAIGSILQSRKLPLYDTEVLESVAQEVLVFGDDIIIPEDSYGTLQEALSSLGLKVNTSKTFSTGKFRESCGMDAYDGVNVTPVYAIRPPDVSRPESILSSVAVHNNFAMRGYYEAADFIKKAVHSVRRFAFRNVAVGSGAFGWYERGIVSNGHLKMRWNGTLHRLEYLVDRTLVKARPSPFEGSGALLQFFTEPKDEPSNGIVDLRFIRDMALGPKLRPASHFRRRWEPVVL